MTDAYPDSWSDEAQADVYAPTETEPEKPVIELPWLSNSQLSSFLRCGEQYRLQKVEKAPQTPAAWLASGRAFHAAAEAWELSDRQMTSAECAELSVVRFDEEIAELRQEEPDIEQWLTGGRTKPKADIASRREKVPKWVAEYIVYAMSQPWRVWQSPSGPAIELKFRIEFSGCIVIGYIDQVIAWPDQTLQIGDHKTGSKQPDSPDQLGLYALGLEVEFGEEFRPETGFYYMAKDGKTTFPYNLSGYTFEKMERWFNAFAKSRELQLFIPNISDGTCNPCGVKRFCDAIDGPMAGLYHPDPSIRDPALADYYAELAQLGAN